MCSTPWSASACTTISAPVISLFIVLTPLEPSCSISPFKIEKGPKPLLHQQTNGFLPSAAGASPYHERNFIAHGRFFPFQSCAFISAVALSVKRPLSFSDTGPELRLTHSCAIRERAGTSEK